MDLVGIPWQLTIGPRGIKDGKVEIKRRGEDEKTELSLDDLGDWICERAAS